MMRVAVAGAVSPAVALRDRAGPFAGGLERRRPNASRAPTRGFKAKGRVVVAVVRASSHGDDAKAVGIDTSAPSSASTVEASEGSASSNDGIGRTLTRRVRQRARESRPPGADLRRQDGGQEGDEEEVRRQERRDGIKEGIQDDDGEDGQEGIQCDE